MKLSTFGLGLAVAATGLAGISSIPLSADAATINFENGDFDFSGVWEFTFLYSSGGQKSTFGINPSTPLFAETNFAVPGSATPNTPVTFNFPASGSFDFFLSSTDGSKIKSSNADDIVGLKAGFILASSLADVPASGFVSEDTDTSGVTTRTFASLVTEFAKDGALVIGVNDTFAGDADYNDFIVKARAVPVPAIVPGIALAAAFLGSKALKRNKKNVVA